MIDISQYPLYVQYLYGAYPSTFREEVVLDLYLKVFSGYDQEFLMEVAEAYTDRTPIRKSFISAPEFKQVVLNYHEEDKALRSGDHVEARDLYHKTLKSIDEGGFSGHEATATIETLFSLGCYSMCASIQEKALRRGVISAKMYEWRDCDLVPSDGLVGMITRDVLVTVSGF